MQQPNPENLDASASSISRKGNGPVSVRWVVALGMLAMLCLGLWWSGSAQGQAGGAHAGGGLQNGRFRLFKGEYVVREEPNNINSREVDSRGFFKLDTATGRSWRYNANVGLAGKWEEVQN